MEWKYLLVWLSLFSIFRWTGNEGGSPHHVCTSSCSMNGIEWNLLVCKTVKFARCPLVLYLNWISLWFAFHAHHFAVVMYMCSFLYIHIWTLPITASALLLTTEQLHWRTQVTQGHYSDCSLVRGKCYVLSRHISALFQHLKWQPSSHSIASGPRCFYTTLNLKLILHLKEMQKNTHTVEYNILECCNKLNWT